MKKLRLDLDTLAVQTFETDRADGIGTVMAAAQAVGGVVAQTYPNCSEIDACPSAWCTPNGTCYDLTCGSTCAETCAKTCANTCPQSCYLPGCSGPVCAA